MDRSNRYLRLQAAFSPANGQFDQPVGYGTAMWRGYFDALYTQAGDYLAQGRHIWFVAAQENLLPVLCVKTNRTISIARSVSPSTGDAYGSATPNATKSVISGWPASVLGTHSSDKPPARLPTDISVPSWTILLPPSVPSTVCPGDIITDNDGSTSVVVAAEFSDLGWRLNARLVTT